MPLPRLVQAKGFLLLLIFQALKPSRLLRLVVAGIGQIVGSPHTGLEFARKLLQTCPARHDLLPRGIALLEGLPHGVPGCWGSLLSILLHFPPFSGLRARTRKQAAG